MIFWNHVLDKLQDNQKVYVLTVIENLGSSPGRKGFKMLVAQDGFIFGSVGGGVMEFSLVEKAQQLLLGENPPTCIKKQVHRKTTQDGSGMICSGEQTVAFHCLGFKHIAVIQDILACLQNGNKGTLCLTPASYHFSPKYLGNQFEYEINSNEDWLFEEHIGFRDTLYIVGGGHVGAAVSELCLSLGFYIIVLDNRQNLNTLDSNNSAHQKLVIDYNNIDDFVPHGNENYVAIMTNTYTDDKLVVSKLLPKKHAYIGVLGSKAKLRTMWKALLEEGFTQSELDALYAPIGLSIKSETPAEIAVSIAAQIIQIKNGNRK